MFGEVSLIPVNGARPEDVVVDAEGCVYTGVEDGRTEYDVDEAVERYRASGWPGIEQIVEMTVTPPERREVIDHAEKVVFAG